MTWQKELEDALAALKRHEADRDREEQDGSIERLRRDVNDVISQHPVLAELLPTSDQWHLYSLSSGYPYNTEKLKSALTDHVLRAVRESGIATASRRCEAFLNGVAGTCLPGFDITLFAGLDLSERWDIAPGQCVVPFQTAQRQFARPRARFPQLSFWLNSRFVCICDRIPGTSGGWIVDIKGFQVWLSAARGLTRAQRREALAVLSGRSEGEASKAAIELGVDEARRCPHCASEGAVSRGMARGLRRYQCKGCGRTFNALSGTPLSGLHHKERWLSFGASLAKGETVKASAARCDVAVSTAFRWRHRFLAAARSDSEVLKGIVEADETYVLESRKGARGLGRKARRRGGKAKKRGLSREQVPVLMAADRSGTSRQASASFPFRRPSANSQDRERVSPSFPFSGSTQMS